MENSGTVSSITELRRLAAKYSDKEQINYFLQSARILPPCPGDAPRTAKGLSPLDDYYTTKDSDSMSEDGTENEDDEL
ncbi:hypothetical protein P3L10_026102 [Capsicum annuum]